MSKLMVAFVLAAGVAFAGENLIQNGTFEGTGSQAAWGAYANHASFSCANWTFNPTNGGGLGKPNGTWMASGLAVGEFACFMQPANRNVTVSQTIASVPAGTYRVEFKYTCRPNMGPGVVEAWLNSTQIGERKSTTATSLQNFSYDINVPTTLENAAFKLVSPDQKADKDVAVEGVVMRRLDAAIGAVNYFDFAEAMKVAAADDVITYTTAGNDATFATATYLWNGNLPKVQVPGVCNVLGTITVAAYGCTVGTYTILEAGSFNFATGASFVLDGTVTDRLERTLAVDGNKLVLTVTARDPATVTEYVVNGNFDIPGCQYGVNGANTWGYNYNSSGFALPGWVMGNVSWTAGTRSLGLSAANGTWLATGQTNGGTLSLYMQSDADNYIAQEFGTIPAGIYRYTFKYACRPSHGSTKIAADVLRGGSALFTFTTPVIGNTALADIGAVVSLPAAGATGIKLTDKHPDTADRAGVLDDISFRREAVTGWSLVDGVTEIAGAASVPVYSYVDGSASFAAGATPSFTVNSLQVPTLTVKDTLTVNGAVTLSVIGTADLIEADYVLIDAANISLGEGASIALDPNATFKNDLYRGWLVVTGKQVILRIRNYNTDSTNNYLVQESERTDTLFSTASSWSRGHVPDSTDNNAIFNYPGTLKFDSNVTLAKTWYFRNGLEAPLIFDATDDEYGFTINGNNDWLHGCGGTFTCFLEFRKGTYEGYSFFLTGNNGAGPNSRGRVDFTGATVHLRNCLQCGYSTDIQSWVNITGGSVTLDSGYNGNIQARTYNKFRMSGGTFNSAVVQLLAGAHSVFDGELSGGDFYVSNFFRLGYGTTGATGRFVLSGGTLHLNSLITQPSATGEATLLASGGALAPYSATTSWMNGGTVTAPVGGAVILDTDGFDATIAATLVDAAGGNAYGITKRGAGRLQIPDVMTFTGDLRVEGGNFSVANGACAERALPRLVLLGGARLAIDVNATDSDLLAPTSVDLTGASAANPVTIDVDLSGIAEIAIGKEYPILSGGLAAGDAEKFVVNGVDGKVKVVDGTLYLLSGARIKVVTEWSGAADDGGLWSTDGNWTGGEAPQSGDTAVFNLGAGGTTLFDITGLAVGGIRFGAGAGAFTHTGSDTLKVTGAITNLSSNVQTFEMPLALGVVGQSVEVNSAGTTIITGAVTTAASTLVKKGSGVLGVRDTAVLSADAIVVEEGTLRIDERTGSSDYSRISAIVLSSVDQVVWRNVKLADVTGVSGLTTGSSMGTFINLNWTPYFWTNDGTSASVQFQFWDSQYTKCICVAFTQVGSDVAARATRACYSNGNTNVLGQDMSTGHNNQTLATAIGGAGYGVYAVRPTLSGGTELNTITVKNGGALDVNAAGNGDNLAIGEAVHGKKLKIEGTGPNGDGAIYNSAPYSNWGSFLGEVELTGNAKVGGTHLSLRSLTGSSHYPTSLTGPYTLEIATDGAGDNNYFNIYAAALDVAQIDVTGKLQMEGASTGVVSNGFHFVDGSTFRPYSTTIPVGMPLCFNPGASVSVKADGGNAFIDSTVSIGAGATATTSGSYAFVCRNAVTNEGTIVAGNSSVQFWGPSLEGGNYVANSALYFGGQIDSPDSAITVSGGGTLGFGVGANEPLAGYPKFASVTSTATGKARFLTGVSDTIDGHLFDQLVSTVERVELESDADVTTTLLNATWNQPNNGFHLGSNARFGRFVIGDGAIVSTPKYFYISDDAANKAIKGTTVEVLTGGSLTMTGDGNGFQIGRSHGSGQTEEGYYSDVIVNGGTLSFVNGTILVGVSGAKARMWLKDGLLQVKRFDVHHLNNTKDRWAYRADRMYIQDGGTLELGSDGFHTAWPSLGAVHADIANGTLRATDNLTNQYGLSAPTFGASPANEGQKLTFDLNGQAVTWNAPLAGGTDLTITGNGSFASTVNLQSIPVGHVTITNTTSEIGLQGAAGFAGGLTLAPGTSARVDIAHEGLVEWGMFNTAQFANIDALLAYDGPLPFTADEMRELNTSWVDQNSKKPGNNTLLCYRGEFEVKPEQAGTWYFAGNVDDNIALVIDGETLFKTTGWTNVGTGSKELAAGWHTFKICTFDATGASGPAQADWKNSGMAVGWTLDSAKNGSVNHADYARFDADTVPMRLAAGERSRTSVRVRVKGAVGSSNYTTYNNPDEKYNQYDYVTNTMDVVNISGVDTNNRFEPACGTNVRYDGYFLVPEEKEGQWAFTVQYDDRITLHVDDVLVAESTSWQNPVTGNRELSAGWHKFTIWAVDQSTAFGTGFGPTVQKDDDGVSCAVGVVMPGDAKKYAFNGKNFRIAANSLGAAKAAEMAGFGGVTTLGAGATLANATNRGSCPIYGTLEGSGALSGMFAFKGAKSTLRVKGKAGRLTEKPDFAGVIDNNYLKGLAKIDAVFPQEKAGASRYVVCAAGALTASEAANIAVTVTNPGNEVATDWNATVVNGNLVLNNPHPAGVIIYVR